MENTTLSDALDEHVVLVHPSIGWWKGVYQLPHVINQTTYADSKAVNRNEITTPRVKLITKTYPVTADGTPWKSIFQKIETKLTKLKNEYSIPYPIPGVRIIPKIYGEEFLDKLYGRTFLDLKTQYDTLDGLDIQLKNKLESQIQHYVDFYGSNLTNLCPVFNENVAKQSIAYEFYQAATKFCNSWEDIKAQIAEHSTVYKYIKDKLPKSQADVRHKFNISVATVEITNNSATQIDKHALNKYSDVIREACTHKVNTAIENMIAEPREQLAKALNSLADLVHNNNKINRNSFNGVRSAIRKIKLFDFVANEQLLDKINELDTKLSNTAVADVIQNNTTSLAICDMISDTLTEVTNEVQRAEDAERFGPNMRKISRGS